MKTESCTSVSWTSFCRTLFKRSEIFGDSLALYVDTMYGRYVDGAVQVSKAAATGQTANGTATEATGTDLSGWVSYDSTDGISMTLAGAANYRTSGASKAIPGFDVMDYFTNTFLPPTMLRPFWRALIR